MNVTTAERSKEKPMSTIDSENTSKPSSEAQPKVRRKPAKKAKAAKKTPWPKKDRQLEVGRYQQKGRSYRDDETREGSDIGRNHVSNWLAAAHSTGLR
jgi:hypothetical protein